jgi:hypothetical protein
MAGASKGHRSTDRGHRTRVWTAVPGTLIRNGVGLGGQAMLEAFKKKPEVWIWVLLALIAFSLFNQYRTGNEFSAVCSNFLEYYEGTQDLGSDYDLQNLEQVGKEILESALNEHKRVESILNEHKRFEAISNKMEQDGYISLTVEEKKFLEERHLRSIGREIESTCQSWLADPIDYADRIDY